MTNVVDIGQNHKVYYNKRPKKLHEVTTEGGLLDESTMSECILVQLVSNSMLVCMHNCEQC